jgi:hypothetical protein
MIVQYVLKQPVEESEPAAKEGGTEKKSAESQPAKPEH